MMDDLKYFESDFYIGKCRACGHRTSVFTDKSGVPEQYVDWCLDCMIEDQGEGEEA